MLLYCRCTDQLINPQKYSALFGTLFSGEAKNSVRGVLQIEKEAFDEKYLGLPTTEGKMNKDKFQPVKERFGKRLADWSDKNLRKRSFDKTSSTSPCHIYDGSL